MSSITLHNLDQDLELIIREKAKENGDSLNVTIQKILKNSLGIIKSGNNDKEFDDLFGIWNKKDFEEFENNIKDFEEINKSDWE